MDPLESNYTPWSSYNYGFDNPITWQDSTGMEPDRVGPIQNTDLNAKPSATKGGVPLVDINAILRSNEAIKNIDAQFAPNGKYGSEGISLNIGNKSLASTDEPGMHTLAATYVKIQLIDMAEPIDLIDLREDQVNKISDFRVDMVFDPSQKDYDLIANFPHELAHAVDVANLALQFKSGEIKLAEFKASYQKNTSESANAFGAPEHQNIGNNTGVFNEVSQSILDQLTQLPNAMKDHGYVLSLGSASTRDLGSSGSNSTKGSDLSTSYEVRDSFYNKVVNMLNSQVSDYNRSGNYKTFRNYVHYQQGNAGFRNIR